jgi:Superinfection immunity protein
MHLLFLIALYFLPAIIAHSRHSVSAVGITIVNLLFGWTGIGWIVTLLWAIFSTSWDNQPYQQHYYAARYPARW